MILDCIFVAGFFISLSNPKSVPLPEILDQDPFSFTYLIPPMFALVTNAATRIYSAILSRKFAREIGAKKFAISLENGVAFSLAILLQIFASFFDRRFRFYINYPAILAVCCVGFPLAVVLKNRRMKAELESLIYDLISWPNFCCFGETKVEPFPNTI